MKPLNDADILKVKQSKHAYNYVQGLKDEISQQKAELEERNVLLAEFINRFGEFNSSEQHETYQKTMTLLNKHLVIL